MRIQNISAYPVYNNNRKQTNPAQQKKQSFGKLIDGIKELAMVNYGGILSPFNAWLITRGLTTLPIRMKQHSGSALKVAEFLESCPAVRFVWYPGLKSHPQHERAEKLMNGQYSGMISFDIKGDEEIEVHYNEKAYNNFIDKYIICPQKRNYSNAELIIEFLKKLE